jgi:hypothetical protein
MAKGPVHIWNMRQTVSKEHKGRAAEVLVACLGLDKARKLALWRHRALTVRYIPLKMLIDARQSHAAY